MKNGYNPMRWDCEKDGCFNKKCRPKIEVFAECFPGRIGFGDLDAIVEIGGRKCALEWKSITDDLPIGQMITFRSLVRDDKFTIFCVVGDAETMEVSHVGTFNSSGEFEGYREANLSDLKIKLREWVSNGNL
jgi:hypothetical protein|tara:strand:- start:4177 stop:4572 length:396 start_codon:yes stop_codon:yes gene_type:complete